MEDPETDQEALIQEAWRLIGELVHTGSAKLMGGKVITPDARALMMHLQWLANLNKPRRKLSLPEDVWKPKETV